jgi:hypothetical protein
MLKARRKSTTRSRDAGVASTIASSEVRLIRGKAYRAEATRSSDCQDEPVRRRGRLAVGVALVVVGTFATVAGAAIVALVGLDGSVGIAPTRFLGSGVALTLTEVDVPSLPGGRHPVLDATAAPGDVPLFVGIGRSDDVDAYLRGAPVDVIQQIDWPGAARTEPVAGTTTPPPPESTAIWVTSATGTAPSLHWVTQPGDWTLVVMRQDAQPSLDVTLSGEVTIPGLGPLGVALLALALAVLGLGVVLTVRGARS